MDNGAVSAEFLAMVPTVASGVPLMTLVIHLLRVSPRLRVPVAYVSILYANITKLTAVSCAQGISPCPSRATRPDPLIFSHSRC